MDKESLDSVLGTVHALLLSEDMDEASAVVRTYPARAEQTGFDNWNGGTELWTIYFDVPPRDYARMGPRRTHVEKQITAQLKAVVQAESQAWYTVMIVPSRTLSKEWRADGSPLPKELRMNIVDGLRLEGVSWQGELNDVELLSRLYDLEQLPSNDSRFETAAGDIWQHTVNNDDWDHGWVFADDRLSLLNGSAESFLRFLCEIVHPVVRPDRDVAVRLVSHFNDQLRSAGWELFEEDLIGGRPRFAYRKVTHQGTRAVSRARTVADALDAGWMAKEIQRLEKATDSDPDLAIGTAKELVETCCKTILGKLGVEYGRSADVGDLTKLVVKGLNLVPEGISDEAKGADNIRLILRNLTSITHNLAQLRGLYGTGHGRDGGHRGLQPRHARLAVASAVAFIDFIAETYRARGYNE
jgi:hypothetical protein